VDCYEYTDHCEKLTGDARAKRSTSVVVFLKYVTLGLALSFTCLRLHILCVYGLLNIQQVFCSYQSVSPEVHLPVSKMGQFINKEQLLDCLVTANPHGVMTWLKDGVDLALDGYVQI